MRLMLSAAIGIAIAGALIMVVVRATRRRTREIPELNQHPERLDQMLDPTDDA